MSALHYMWIHGFLGCLRIFVTEKAKRNELTNQEKKCKTAKFLKQVYNVATMQIQPLSFMRKQFFMR